MPAVCLGTYRTKHTLEIYCRTRANGTTITCEPEYLVPGITCYIVRRIHLTPYRSTSKYHNKWNVEQKRPTFRASCIVEHHHSIGRTHSWRVCNHFMKKELRNHGTHYSTSSGTPSVQQQQQQQYNGKGTTGPTLRALAFVTATVRSCLCVQWWPGNAIVITRWTFPR